MAQFSVRKKKQVKASLRNYNTKSWHFIES